jgi:hypothetical protein
MATTDGGGTWTSQTLRGAQFGASAHGISCPNASTCFAVGGASEEFHGFPTVVVTTNGGSTWIEPTLPPTQNFGAPPTFTLRLNQSSTTSLNWIAPGGQAGYVLVAIASNGSQRYQVLPATATSATDDTAGQPTCYVLISLTNGSALGNSDAECGVPGGASMDAQQSPPPISGVTSRRLATPSLSEAANSLRQAAARARDVHHLLPDRFTSEGPRP